MADFTALIKWLDGAPSVVFFTPPSDHPYPHDGPMPVLDMFEGRIIVLRGPECWDSELPLPAVFSGEVSCDREAREPTADPIPTAEAGGLRVLRRAGDWRDLPELRRAADQPQERVE